MLALERRAFVRAGIEVKWLMVPQGTGEMCRMLDAEELDMAVLVTEGAVRAIHAGGAYKVVGALVDTPLTWGVHVGASTALRASEDLVGVPYAISRKNSGSHLMAIVHAQRNGWVPAEKDFIIVNDLKGAEERLRTPEPCIFLWEKYMTASLVHGGVFRRVDELNTGWPAFLVVARDQFLAEHPAAVDLLLRVFRDQAKGLMEKKAAVDMVAQRYGMTAQDAKEWFSEVRWNLDGLVDPAMLREVGRVLHASGPLNDPIGAAEAAAMVRSCASPK
jgi:ABC-type nitrate/sulfonate/bicarbonate transport system substrate-binding protein